MEQLNYNLLYRWFVGLSPDDPIYPVRLIGRKTISLNELLQRALDG